MRSLTRSLFVLLLLCGMALTYGQTFSYVDLHNFGSGSDGQVPSAGVSFDKHGNMFGTTSDGGTNTSPNSNGQGDGTVWELTDAGIYEVLHDFGAGTDGEFPNAVIRFDGAGNLYGTTSLGGAYTYGMIWEITASGVYRDLHDFGSGDDGRYPSPVTFDASGNMYGTTTAGGLNSLGTIWEILANGGYRDLHDFGAGTDGFYPDNGGVTFDSSGDMYGTASNGGAHGQGTVWEISALGAYSDVHDFGAGTDGASPNAGVTIDPAGNLYGTTSEGGLTNNGGMVWEIPATGGYEDLHDFGNGQDGREPNAGVTRDPTGNLYGTTSYGGANSAPFNGAGGGMVWEITTTGAYRDLHDFGAGQDGYFATGGVTSDSAGNLYGPTQCGGTDIAGNFGMGGGILWELSLSVQVASVTLDPSSVTGGSPSAGTVTLSGPAPAGGLTVSLSSSSADSTVPTSVTVLSGQTTASFSISTIPYTATVTSKITARHGAVSQSAVLSIQAPWVTQMSLSPSTVIGGSSSTGTVTISGPAPSTGMVVSLTSSSLDATVPSSVKVLAGQTTATFTINTVPYTQTVNSEITGRAGGASGSALLWIDEPVLTEISFSPDTVTGGSSSVGTVTLSGPAPSAGVTVWLASNRADATVPSSVKVLAGQTTATFTLTTSAVTSNVTVTIGGRGNGVNQTATVTLTP